MKIIIIFEKILIYKSKEIQFLHAAVPSVPAFPLSAITLLAGFIMAESADIGRLIGFWGSAISTMTTCATSPVFSRTQIYLSDSMVSVLKLMFD